MRAIYCAGYSWGGTLTLTLTHLPLSGNVCNSTKPTIESKQDFSTRARDGGRTATTSTTACTFSFAVAAAPDQHSQCIHSSKWIKSLYLQYHPAYARFMRNCVGIFIDLAKTFHVLSVRFVHEIKSGPTQCGKPINVCTQRSQRERE